MTSRTLLVALALFTVGCAGTPVEPPAAPPNAGPHKEIPGDVPPPPPSAPPVIHQTADKSPLRLTIAAVGDMMLGTDYPENRLPDDDGNSFLTEVSSFLAAADFAVGNLEGVLADGGQPKKVCDNPNACYLFRSPTRYANHYKDAGFDALSLANNHARDFGEDGRSSSMDTLSRAEILHSGRDGTYATSKVNGLDIVFIAYSVTQKSNLLHDYAKAFSTIARLAIQHDIVIVSFHGGAEGANVMRLPFAEEEYYGEPRGDVVRFARGAVDAGADLVIGHGPHVVRAMERYKDRLIAYSLGNFATYYGISVSGNKGVAPILTATLDGNGAFLNGEIVSTIQRRPRGPSVDPDHRALKLIVDLSQRDFGNSGLKISLDGRMSAVPRGQVKNHPLVIRPD